MGVDKSFTLFMVVIAGPYIGEVAIPALVPVPVRRVQLEVVKRTLPPSPSLDHLQANHSQFEQAPRVESASRGPASIGPASNLTANSVPVHVLYVDESGLIVQADGDGGDTAQRVGMFYFAYRDADGFTHALQQLEVQPGIYVRNPHQEGFRSDPTEFSRDQERALVIAMGTYEMHDRLSRLFWAHVKRFGKYQNKDWLGPSHAGEYIRAFNARWLYPVLAVTDIALLVNSIRLVAIASINNDDVDDNNHIMSLLQAREVMPTVASWLAAKVYRHFRPRNNGNVYLHEESAIQGTLSWYHRRSSGGNPIIAELYRDALAEL